MTALDREELVSVTLTTDQWAKVSAALIHTYGRDAYVEAEAIRAAVVGPPFIGPSRPDLEGV